jgi:hypothetical protein
LLCIKGSPNPIPLPRLSLLSPPPPLSHQTPSPSLFTAPSPSDPHRRHPCLPSALLLAFPASIVGRAHCSPELHGGGEGGGGGRRGGRLTPSQRGERRRRSEPLARRGGHGPGISSSYPSASRLPRLRPPLRRVCATSAPPTVWSASATRPHQPITAASPPFPRPPARTRLVSPSRQKKPG